MGHPSALLHDSARENLLASLVTAWPQVLPGAGRRDLDDERVSVDLDVHRQREARGVLHPGLNGVLTFGDGEACRFACPQSHDFRPIDVDLHANQITATTPRAPELDLASTHGQTLTADD